MRYNPALDGVRAIAIAFVVIFHTEKSVLPSGWIGVDMFFTLSGYLITSILLKELRETGRLSMRNFYIRRALRLFPALAILAAVQLTRSWFSPVGPEIRGATLVAVTYLMDFNLVFRWAPIDLVGPTWSLAVEEQFYLIWPPFLLLLIDRSRRPRVWVGVFAIAMVIARIIFWDHKFAVDFSPWIRPVGLLIGCGLAFMPVVKWRIPPHTGIAALATIALVVLSTSWQVYIIAPMLTAIETAALIVCLQQPGPVTSALSVAPVRYIGRISYGIYLYHWPIFRLAEKFNPHPPFHLYAIGLIGVTVGIAALSYELVEKPILRLKGRLTAPPVVEVETSTCKILP